jgi:hypothetical protein
MGRQTQSNRKKERREEEKGVRGKEKGKKWRGRRGGERKGRQRERGGRGWRRIKEKIKNVEKENEDGNEEIRQSGEMR